MGAERRAERGRKGGRDEERERPGQYTGDPPVNLMPVPPDMGMNSVDGLHTSWNMTCLLALPDEGEQR
eukprot:2712452-Rhodomonas_salina.1